MATVQGTEKNFEQTLKQGIVLLRDGVLLLRQPGMVPASAIDELVRQVRALDMNQVRRHLDEVARASGAADDGAETPSKGDGR